MKMRKIAPRAEMQPTILAFLTGHGGWVGRALVSRAGERGFEPVVESNQWLLELILVAS